jgi:hypothetical protein
MVDRLLGWFTDNELRWESDWRGPDELLTMFLALPADAPAVGPRHARRARGHAAAVQFLRERYDKIEKFNDVWKTSFASWDQLTSRGSLSWRPEGIG